MFHPDHWLIPKTIHEATEILARHGAEVLLYAGGTYFHELRERGLLDWVKVVVDLQALGLNYIKSAEEGIKIGATATPNDLVSCDLLRGKGFESLIQAAYAMGPEQIKNAATVGGAVACGVAIIDIIPALASLGAKAAVIDSSETRQVDLIELLKNGEPPLLGRRQIIAEVVLPHPSAGTGSSFRKFRRSASDWPVVNASASVRIGKSRNCLDACVVFGSRPEGYFRLTKAGEFLVGKEIDEKALKQMSEIILDEIHVEDEVSASAGYKRALAKTLVWEAVLRAAESGSSQKFQE